MDPHGPIVALFIAWFRFELSLSSNYFRAFRYVNPTDRSLYVTVFLDLFGTMLDVFWTLWNFVCLFEIHYHEEKYNMYTCIFVCVCDKVH